MMVSDIHLSPQRPRTGAAFLAFVQRCVGRTKALYLLGDVFEYWAGDEMLEQAFYQEVVQALAACAAAGVKLYWQDGNRDFLVGPRFFAETGCTPLSDPTVHCLGRVPTLLSHGDQYCIDDLAYMGYRTMVRAPQFRGEFLAKSMAERLNMIEAIRAQSKMKTEVSDVNHAAIAQLFCDYHVTRIVHGHTHQSAVHTEGVNTRWVLSDWEFDQMPTRANMWAVDAKGYCALAALPGSM